VLDNVPRSVVRWIIGAKEFMTEREYTYLLDREWVRHVYQVLHAAGDFGTLSNAFQVRSTPTPIARLYCYTADDGERVEKVIIDPTRRYAKFSEKRRLPSGDKLERSTRIGYAEADERLARGVLATFVKIKRTVKYFTECAPPTFRVGLDLLVPLRTTWCPVAEESFWHLEIEAVADSWSPARFEETPLFVDDLSHHLVPIPLSKFDEVRTRLGIEGVYDPVSEPARELAERVVDQVLRPRIHTADVELLLTLGGQGS